MPNDLEKKRAHYVEWVSHPSPHCSLHASDDDEECSGHGDAAIVILGFARSVVFESGVCDSDKYGESVGGSMESAGI